MNKLSGGGGDGYRDSYCFVGPGSQRKRRVARGGSEEFDACRRIEGLYYTQQIEAALGAKE